MIFKTELANYRKTAGAREGWASEIGVAQLLNRALDADGRPLLKAPGATNTGPLSDIYGIPLRRTNNIKNSDDTDARFVYGADWREEIEEFVARAQSILQRRKARSGRSLELHAREGAIDDQRELVDIEGLAKVVVGALLHGLDGEALGSVIGVSEDDCRRHLQIPALGTSSFTHVSWPDPRQRVHSGSTPIRSECVKLSKEQVTVAKNMKERGTSVRQVAKQLGVTEGALRYRIGKLGEEVPDGRANQPTALDGYEGAVLVIQERLGDGRLTGEGRPCQVREMYDVGDDRLLMVASDRLSAFDVVLDRPIPRKGEVLTAVTVWWLEQLGDLVPNHLIAADPEAIVAAVPELAESRRSWAGRALLVRKTRPVPVECVVRGYLTGSAWKEYAASGTLAGEPLPEGLVESDRLDPPVFSPATKAESGHDENITFAAMKERVDPELASELRRLSLAIYERGRALAAERGIILADTKFEFGVADDRPILIDEVMTPDSSRFWPEESWEPGRSQPSLDKQPVRDYLDDLTLRGEWDKRPPPPDLPDRVVADTTARYLEVHRRLTGRELGE